MGVPVISSKHNGGHEVLTPLNGSIIESLTDVEAFAEVLKSALKKRKTRDSAKAVRETVRHLDFSHQLKRMTDIVVSK
jgi:glycosyltransferase involved in cell wall biosynthesis